MTCRRSTLCLTSLLAGLLLSAVAPASPIGRRDALSRSEFDNEISIEMSEIDVAVVFRAIARATEVPFLLQFPVERGTKVSLRADKMVARAVLVSLGSAYGFEYESTPDGVAVRRRGVPPTPVSTRVGEWPETAYWLDLQVRPSAGAAAAAVRVTVQPGRVQDVAIPLPPATVTALDRKRAVVAPQQLDRLALALAVSGETDAALQLAVEVVTTRRLGPGRYSQEHTAVSAAAPQGESTLVSDGNVEVRLTEWGRVGR
jgi:hypothetical protein